MFFGGLVGTVVLILAAHSVPQWIGPAIMLVSFFVAAQRSFDDAVAEREATIAAKDDEIARLRAELDDVRARQPEVAVAFATADGPSAQGHLVTSRLSAPDFDGLVADQQKHLMAKYRKAREDRRAESARELGVVSSAAALGPGLSGSAIPPAISGYLDQYRQYLVDLHEAQRLGNSVGFLSFALVNRGRAVAETVRVEILLPPGLETPTEDQWFAYQDTKYLPSPPKEPTVSDMLNSGNLLADIVRRMSDPIPAPAIEPAVWDAITPAQADDPPEPRWTYGSNRVLLPVVDRLNAGDTLDDFGRVPVWIGDLTEDTTFEIEARITAANLPQPQIQHLTLHVTVTGARKA